MATGTANPFFIEPAKANISPILQGIGSLMKKSRDEDKRMSDSKILMDAYKAGDPDKIAQLLAGRPELGQQLSSMIGFKDQASEKNYAETVRRLASTTDPETRGQVLVDRIDYVNSQGGNPTQSVTMLDELQRNPEQFEKNLDIEFASTQGKPAWDAYKAQRGLGGDAENRTRSTRFYANGVTRQSKDSGTEVYNSSNVRLYGKEAAAAIAEANRMEISQAGKKAAAKSSGRTSGTLEEEIKLRPKLASALKKKDRISKFNASIDASDRAIESVNELINHPGLSSAAGIGSAFPTAPGSDAAVFEALLESFDSKLFSTAIKQMKGMGSLSDAEGKKISSAVGTLSLKMSDKALKKSLNTIKDGLQKSKLRAISMMEPGDRISPQSTAQEDAAGIQDLTTEEQAELEQLRAMKAAQSGR